jgi:hypothetical protein
MERVFGIVNASIVVACERLTVIAKEIERSHVLSIDKSRQTFDGVWTNEIHWVDATQHRGFGRTWYLQSRLYSLVPYCSIARA